MVEEPQLELLPGVGREPEPAIGVETPPLDPDNLDPVGEEILEVVRSELDVTFLQFGYEDCAGKLLDVVDVPDRPFPGEHWL